MPNITPTPASTPALGRYYEPGPPLNVFVGGVRVRIVAFQAEFLPLQRHEISRLNHQRPPYRHQSVSTTRS
jgi:hypothetical protein